jgi:lipopolysaccharide biosynthesis glycosyltransferase
MVAEKFCKEVRFIDMILPDSWQNACSTNEGIKNYFTKGALYRLLLPEVVPHLDKVIYLDCDVIVDVDIQALWAVDLQGQPLAAALDAGIKSESYFNSGVLVLSLDFFRTQYSLVELVTEFLSLHPKTLYPDQDFLNWLVKGAFVRLNSQFNSMVGEAEQFLQENRILHFAGRLKPWEHYRGSAGYKYWKYLKLTPWGEDALEQLYLMGQNQKERVGQLDAAFKNSIIQKRSFVGSILDAAIAERYRELAEMIVQITQRCVYKGPFRGMLLPIDFSWGTVGDACSKLLGTYEEELHPIIERLCKIQYQWVLDIGCAEGYYAIGLARAMPHVNVLGFDIDEKARRICSSSAEENGVRSRVDVEGRCTPEILKGVLAAIINKGGRCLIKMDVEGCEFELLDTNVIPELQKCDVLVECHDFWRPGLSQTLVNRFAGSHEIQLIHQAGRDPLQIPFLRNLPDRDRWLAINEGRAAATHWLSFQSNHWRNQ